jgi:hypothetical protein
MSENVNWRRSPGFLQQAFAYAHPRSINTYINFCANNKDFLRRLALRQRQQALCLQAFKPAPKL